MNYSCLLSILVTKQDSLSLINGFCLCGRGGRSLKATRKGRGSDIDGLDSQRSFTSMVGPMPFFLRLKVLSN